MNNDFILAQLRHSYAHFKNGRIVSGIEVLASVIRRLEKEQ